MLAVGTTRGYALLNSGELESYLDGRSRRITVRSIRSYVARKLEREGGATAKVPTPHAPRKTPQPQQPPASTDQQIRTTCRR
jgi:hypothetical protein